MSGQINQTPVLPGNHRTLSTQIPMPKTPGSYILVVTGNIDGKAVEKSFVLTR